jgi:hypothetical protein
MSYIVKKFNIIDLVDMCVGPTYGESPSLERIRSTQDPLHQGVYRVIFEEKSSGKLYETKYMYDGSFNFKTYTHNMAECREVEQYEEVIVSYRYTTNDN